MFNLHIKIVQFDWRVLQEISDALTEPRIFGPLIEENSAVETTFVLLRMSFVQK